MKGGGLWLFYQLQGLKLTLCAAQVEADVILGMYLISPSPCVFQGSFVIEKRGKKGVGKSTHMLFFSN